MNLNQLKVFYYTAKFGSISKAADELCVTQPAVTKQIKKFQTYYNITFFNKFGRKVVLTDAGKSLYRIAERIFEIENQAEELIRDFQQLKSGNIHILTVESFGAYYLPYIAGLFNKSYPKIHISTYILSVEEVIKNTLKFNCDIGFVSFINQCDNLVAEEILEDIIVLIVPPDHPLTRKRYVDPKDLQGMDMVMSETGSGTRTIADNFITEHKILIHPTYECSNSEEVKRAVENGMGLSLLSLNVVQAEIKHNILKAIIIKDPLLVRKFYMIYHKDKYFSQYLNFFIDTVKNWAKKYKESIQNIMSNL